MKIKRLYHQTRFSSNIFIQTIGLKTLSFCIIMNVFADFSERFAEPKWNWKFSMKILKVKIYNIELSQVGVINYCYVWAGRKLNKPQNQESHISCAMPPFLQQLKNWHKFVFSLYSLDGLCVNGILETGASASKCRTFLHHCILPSTASFHVCTRSGSDCSYSDIFATCPRLNSFYIVLQVVSLLFACDSVGNSYYVSLPYLAADA